MLEVITAKGGGIMRNGFGIGRLGLGLNNNLEHIYNLIDVSHSIARF